MANSILEKVEEFGASTTKEITSLKKSLADTQKKLGAAEETLKKIAETPQYSLTDRLHAQPADRKKELQWGFKSVGEFVKEIITSKTKGGITDRLQKTYSSDQVQKTATGMGELIGSDGGFLVPPTFASAIFERLYETDDLLKRTDSYTAVGNSMVFPRNAETSRATGSRWGGVRAYWLQEGSTITASKPTYGRLTLNLHKLACLAALTSELIEDTGTALTQYVNRVFTDEISFQSGDAIINGTGAGQPLGILNAACTVSVSKETGQDAATLVSANIVKMWARMFSGCRKNAVWFINQDVEPQLHLMTLGIGTAGVTTYLPPGGLSQAPYATLMGRPVIPIEFCQTLGTVGDIILADLSQYVTLNKGGMSAESSMHFYFDTDQQALRVVYRLDGQPWWASALTPFKGSNTQSCFVTLATRS